MSEEEKNQSQQTRNQMEYEREGYDPWEDEQYFNSYGDLNLQQSMIQDDVRSQAYRKAIFDHAKSDFVGKTVLDVGCGFFFSLKKNIILFYLNKKKELVC